jgi:hypothetical protein
VVDAQGTAVSYECLADALVDLLEENTSLPTELCLLVADMMDAGGYVALPQGKVVSMRHEPLPDLHDGLGPATHRQIRFRGGGQMMLPYDLCSFKMPLRVLLAAVLVYPADRPAPTIPRPAPAAPAGSVVAYSDEDLLAQRSVREPVSFDRESNKKFLFVREFADSFELLAQDGIALRLRHKVQQPPDWDAAPLSKEDARIRIFYAPAGQCEHRVRPCKTSPDPACDNACCSNDHCATYAAACAHHDLE